RFTMIFNSECFPECGGLTPLWIGVPRLDTALDWSAVRGGSTPLCTDCGGLTPLCTDCGGLTPLCMDCGDLTPLWITQIEKSKAPSSRRTPKFIGFCLFSFLVLLPVVTVAQFTGGPPVINQQPQSRLVG